MSVPSASGSRSDDVDLVLAQILQQVESGQTLDVAAWCQRYPQWAEQVRTFCDDLIRYGRLLGIEQAHCEETRPFCGPVPEVKTLPTETPRLGGYELLQELGRGGMGVVYRARPAGTEREVALKVFNPDQLAGSDGLGQLRAEFNSVCRLKHPHIVPVYHYGEDADRAFYTMELIEGGHLPGSVGDPTNQGPRSLADEMKRLHDDLPLAIEIMEKVARAVHHAHQRQVVHRDLKPGNVLLDAHGEPRVTDFGLAVRLRGDRANPEEVLPGGSLPWMAPEAVRSDRELTTAIDIWALGVILYELLACRRPFSGGHSQMREQIREAKPPRPRVEGKRPDLDLEAICRKCMKKNPAERYGSAEALAEDLLRWREGKIPLARERVGAVERVARWCRARPLTVAGPLLGVVFLAVLALAALDALRQQEQRTVEEVTQSNKFLAGHVSYNILGQLQTMADALVDTAEHPVLHRLHEAKETEKLRRFLEAEQRRHNHRLSHKLGSSPEVGPLVTMILLNPEARYIAEAPETTKSRASRDKAWLGRDYFHQAMKRSRASGRARVHVSRIFQSANDKLFKLALSVPVPSRDNPEIPLGVLSTTIATGPTFGLTPLSDSRRRVILVGPQDSHDPHQKPEDQSEPPPRYLILLHPAYDDHEVPLAMPTNRLPSLRPRSTDDELDLPAVTADSHSDNDYRDPMAERRPEYAGKWLAAFSQVGNTELVVGVQQHYDEAVAPPQAFLRRFLAWGTGGIAVVLVLIGIVWLINRWRGGAVPHKRTVSPTV